MSETSVTDETNFNEELWHTIFAEGHPLLIEKQFSFRQQGASPRCKLCLAPFSGVSAHQTEIPGPSNRNPRYCSLCDSFIRENPGGAKVNMSMVFVDIRGSTKYSEELDLREYVRLINQFYARTTKIFVETDGFMMDVIGDEVFALYPAGFSGVSENEQSTQQRECLAAQKALQAVKKLAPLGKGSPPDSLPFGVSFHTASVYIGTVRGAEEGISDVRIWGPEVNRAARMCAKAPAGQAIISEAALTMAKDLDTELYRAEENISLKGISQHIALRSYTP
ncbi:adenylate cyclase [Alteromonadaceae bacterium Bs31]|nr:adenylate cyclase [Alteromonadaceae bacterium Bs31]